MQAVVKREMNQDAIDSRLVAIATRHCKLALEGMDMHTTAQRKADIYLEIAGLRIERDWLLSLEKRF